MTQIANKFQAVIFDMDGLLLDSERAIMRAWLESAQALNCPISEADFLPVIGLSIRQSNEHLAALFDSPATFDAVRHAATQRLMAGTEEINYPVKPDAPAFVQAVTGHQIPCAVASSTRVREVKRRLDAVDLLPHFTTVAGGDEVPNGKPDPAVYQLAAQRLGVEPTRCLAFEDSENGIRAALAAGMSVVIVPDLVTPSPDLTAQALHQVQRLSDCHDRLAGWLT